MKWRPEPCCAGDLIRVRIGTIYHFGIFVSENEVIAFGLPPTPEYRTDLRRETVCATDIDTFACGRIPERGLPDRAERKKMFPPVQIVARARDRLGETGYHILFHNCEHFVNECAFGEKRSEQIDRALQRWQTAEPGAPAQDAVKKT